MEVWRAQHGFDVGGSERGWLSMELLQREAMVVEEVSDEKEGGDGGSDATRARWCRGGKRELENISSELRR